MPPRRQTGRHFLIVPARMVLIISAACPPRTGDWITMRLAPDPTCAQTMIRYPALACATVLLSGLAHAQSFDLAITVDDLPAHGQLPPNMTRLGIAESHLHILKAHGVPEAFGFVNAAKIDGSADGAAVLDAWRAAGQPLGNHTWSHMNLARAPSLAAWQADVEAGEPAVAQRMQGANWHYLRLPNLAAGDRFPQAHAWLRARGYQVADVSVAFSDWSYTDAYARCVRNGDTATIGAMKSQYLAAVERGIAQMKADSLRVYGRIIPQVLLTHLGGWSAVTLPDVLARLDQAGARYVTLAQAQADPAYAQPGGGNLVERTARQRGIRLEALAQPDPASALDPNAVCRTPAVQHIVLDGAAGGPRFDGIGIVEGGGGTGVLLKDYPEPQRSQILDLVFKPKFGASVSALYVEIPGDGNATQGSMPSHMHARDDLNYERGYLWWEMREAKRRNPQLTLDGAAWSAPGWLGQQGQIFEQSTGDYYKGDRAFFSQDTANYYVSWLKGLRTVYGMELDAIGMRNEKGASYDFAKALRATLDADDFHKVQLHGFDNWPDPWKFRFVDDMTRDPALASAIDIIGAHINPPKSVVPLPVRQQAAAMGKPIWNTEQHVYKAGYPGLIGMVKAFNENYVRSGVTKVVNWYGIAGLYTMQAYSGEKEAMVRANWPWSGHYSINPVLWGYAHYGQFSEVGWHYLHGGSGDLQGGGTFVTLASPQGDYSIILETENAAARQEVQFRTGGGLRDGDLAVWRTTEHEHFVRQPDAAVRNGVATLTLEPHAVYSLTTTRGQQKGSYDSVPALHAFPFPYRDDFEQYGQPAAWGHLPRYFADIAGAFELARCPARAGTCLRQSVPVPTISWAPDWLPYSIIGNDSWRDYQISVDVYLQAGEAAAVMGRVNHAGNGYGFIPKGYFLELNADGALRLVAIRGKKDKKKAVGDAEQQALIKAMNDDSAGGEKVLATGRVPGARAGRWHTLTLRFAGQRITALVDGVERLAVTDGLYGAGMAGILAGARQDKLSMPWFDNLVVQAAGVPAPAPTPPLPGRSVLYGNEKPVR